ncbi:hypothetical protein LIER_06988 [Lithospermum erythrorhizon]|uniref:Uncharacterized protein n=1 Tax=Lithospermum erythrorhizon TaxID=34254 RepID=A0AAV3P6E9_LITER
MWLKIPSLASTLASVWETERRRTAQYVLCTKLKLLKKPLRELNRAEFGGISNKESRAKKAFKADIIHQMATPDDVALKEEVMVLWERIKSENFYYLVKGMVLRLPLRRKWAPDPDGYKSAFLKANWGNCLGGCGQRSLGVLYYGEIAHAIEPYYCCLESED